MVIMTLRKYAETGNSAGPGLLKPEGFRKRDRQKVSIRRVILLLAGVAVAVSAYAVIMRDRTSVQILDENVASDLSRSSTRIGISGVSGPLYLTGKTLPEDFPVRMPDRVT